MSVFKDTQKALTDPKSQIHWVRLVIAVVGLIALSFGLAALLNLLKSRLNFDLYQHTTVALLSVFISALLANATIIAPVPFAIVIMATAAQHYNPFMVALAGAAGGTLGELSGYYAGWVGGKIALPGHIISNKRITAWVRKFGFWAITVLAFQPIVPFDVGGMVAGAGKMPLIKFIPALFLGKFPKYLIFVFASLGLIKIFPVWRREYMLMSYSLFIVAAAFCWLLIETRFLRINLSRKKNIN